MQPPPDDSCHFRNPCFLREEQRGDGDVPDRKLSLRADFSHPGSGGKTRCSGDSLLSFFVNFTVTFYILVSLFGFLFFFIQSATLESQTVPNSSAGSIPRPDYKGQLLHTLVPPVNRHGFHGSILQLLGAARCYQLRLRCCTFWVKSLL